MWVYAYREGRSGSSFGLLTATVDLYSAAVGCSATASRESPCASTSPDSVDDINRSDFFTAFSSRTLPESCVRMGGSGSGELVLLRGDIVGSCGAQGGTSSQRA